MSLWDHIFGKSSSREERLRNELEIGNRLEVKAERELNRISAAHDRIITNLKWLGSAAFGSVLLVLGGSYIELRETVKTAAEEAAKGVRTQVETRVDTEFKQENIRQTISKAAEEQVRLHAEPLIHSNVSSRFKPMETRLSATLKKADEILRQSEATKSSLFASLETTESRQSSLLKEYDKKAEELRTHITQATNTLNFTVKSVLAQNDDRLAYGWLQRWALTPTNAFAGEASAIKNSIDASYVRERPFFEPRDWDSQTNRHSLSIAELDRNMKKNPQFTTFFVKLVEKQTNITKEVQLTFLRHVYLVDSFNSLQAMDASARIVASRLNVKYAYPFHFGNIENAWSQFTKTNHLFDITQTNGNVFKFEIIHSTNANQVVVNKGIDGSRIVVFALKANPVKADLKGRFIRYSTFVTNEVNVVDVYEKFVSAKFRAWNGDAKKFEFKYLPASESAPTAPLAISPEMIDENGIFKRPTPNK